MSVANVLQQIDFSIRDVLALNTDLEFPDNTIQTTAYQGAGNLPNLEEVLTAGNDAQGLDIVGVDNLDTNTVVVNTQLQLIPSGNSVNVAGEINQVALGTIFNGNQLQPTLVNSNAGASNTFALSITDNTGTSGLNFLPNALDNNYNPIVNANDNVIVNQSTTKSLTICNDGTTTNGIRISDTSMYLGVGGNADVPTSNITFNNPAGQIVQTSTNKNIIQTPDISPTPTLQVTESSTNFSLIVIPKSDGGQYNPLDTNTAVELVAWIDGGVTRDNGQILALVPHSATTCGFRAQAGTGGVGTNAYLEVGCGGTGTDPSQRIRFDNATSQLQMTYTGLNISTGALPNASGGASGLYLPVTINGVAYKIALLNN